MVWSKWFGMDFERYFALVVFVIVWRRFCHCCCCSPMYQSVSLALSLYLIFHTLILLIAFNGMSRAFTLLIDFPLPIHLNFCRRFPNELLFNIRLFYRIYSVCVCAMYLRCICSNFVCSRTGLLSMFIGWTPCIACVCALRGLFYFHYKCSVPLCKCIICVYRFAAHIFLLLASRLK